MDPQSCIYRSPVYRRLQALDADFTGLNGFAVATSVGDPASQAAAVRHSSLCDLSGLSRVGIKGKGISRRLSQEGLSFPDTNNRALRQDDGSVIARLADNEILLLSDLEQTSEYIQRLTEACLDRDHPSGGTREFVVPRQHSNAWFRISGHETATAMAKLCAIDLRPASFDDLQVAQTSVARLNAIVIRDDIAGIASFHLLADSASAEYWWECLLDAGSKYELRVVGLDALRELNRG